MRGMPCTRSETCSCRRAAAGTTSWDRPPAILTGRTGKFAEDDVTHRPGATHPEALASLLQLRQSASERPGADVNVAALAPYCTPMPPPGSLGMLGVGGTEVECI